ncbi:ABC transporter permease [Leisingera sp. M658]|uniref:ABC transporter permease n=1 Tax=Leisingera sp. M658 TaxID=2867015 RepID=UPI0021A38E69|nr:ABC transporter permease [Leisingera sp. M658]UWQ75766.1 ABC transporter permease [Leisingera sp. M658]
MSAETSLPPSRTRLPKTLGRIIRPVAGFAGSSGQAALAVAIVTLVVTISILAFGAYVMDTHITAFDPLKMNIRARLDPPSAEHWMGTDKIGRDMLARVVAGSWISLSVSFAVLTVAAVIGTSFGLIAGYAGGLADEILMRVTDLFLAFPALILAAAIAASFGGGMLSTTIALSAVFWPWYARLIRSRILSLKEQEFIAAARCMGASHLRLIFSDLLPMVWPLVIVQATTDVGFVILAASGLSFLGLGAQPPTPEWGAMIFDSLTHQPASWWLAVFPGGAIALVAIGFNLLGDSLRDHLDPSLGASEAGI